MLFERNETYETPCFRQPDGKPLGTHTTELTVAVHDDCLRGYAEVEIEKLDYYADLGLWFQRNPDGKFELIDFDGAHCLPQRVAEILREEGFLVDSTFE
jgi:hypothetical protein